MAEALCDATRNGIALINDDNFAQRRVGSDKITAARTF